MPPTKKKAGLVRTGQQHPASKRSVVKTQRILCTEKGKRFLGKLERGLARSLKCVQEARHNAEMGEDIFFWMNRSALLLNLNDLRHHGRRARKLLPRAKVAFGRNEGAQ